MTRTVRGFSEHSRSFSSDTVSTTLKNQRNCISPLSAGAAPCRACDPLRASRRSAPSRHRGRLRKHSISLQVRDFAPDTPQKARARDSFVFGSRLVSRSFPVRFGRCIVQTTHTVRGVPEQHQPSSSGTVSTTLQIQRNSQKAHATTTPRRRRLAPTTHSRLSPALDTRVYVTAERGDTANNRERTIHHCELRVVFYKTCEAFSRPRPLLDSFESFFGRQCVISLELR